MEKQWFGPFQGRRGQRRASGQKVGFLFCFVFSSLFVFITMIKMMYNLALVFSPELQQPQLRGVGGALKLMHRRRSKFGW